MSAESSLVIEPSGLGVVSLGREHHAPAGAATVSLQGCLVTVDPCCPDQPPHCLVSDPATAAPVIEALYGSAIARRVAEADGPSAGRGEAAFVAGPELGIVVRLGNVKWLRLNSPLSLDQRLLELEEYVLLGQIDDLLDPLDEQWLEPLVELGPELLRLADGGDFQPDGLEDLVGDALELLANHLPVADRLRVDAAERLAAWAGARSSAHRAALDADRLSRDLAPVGALHAGAETSLYVGSSTVDWGDVPLGATSRAESNVQWALEIGGEAAVVSVGVDGAEPVRPHPAFHRDALRVENLMFDVLLPGWPLPVSAGQLARRERGDGWAGKARLAPPSRDAVEAVVARGETIHVRVHGGATWPPSPVMESEAQRFAARGVLLLRLDSLGPDQSLREVAAASMRRAEALWRAKGFGEAADACGSLAAQAVPSAPRRVWGQPSTVESGPLPHFAVSLAERWFAEAGA